MRTAIELLISKFRALSVLKRGFLLAFAAVACFMILALLTRPATKLANVPGPEYLPLENSAGALQFEPDSLVDEEKLEKTQATLRPSPRVRGEVANGRKKNRERSLRDPKSARFGASFDSE